MCYSSHYCATLKLSMIFAGCISACSYKVHKKGMVINMKVKPEISNIYSEPELHVCNREMNEEVRSLLCELSTLYEQTLNGTDELGNHCRLVPSDIISFYADGQKIMALDSSKVYTIPKKLYELEEQYCSSGFIRISKAELINYKKIKKLDMSFTGTIKIIMKNGYETYASRRNVSKLKKILK